MSQHLPPPPPLITLPLDDDADESDDGGGAERERALRQELLRRKGTEGLWHDDGAAGDGCSLVEAKEILSDFETAREAAEWIRMHSGVLLTEGETATLERRLAGDARARSQSAAATPAAAATVEAAAATASAAVACNAVCHACGGQFVLANYSGPTPTCFPCRQAAGRARTARRPKRGARCPPPRAPVAAAPAAKAPATAAENERPRADPALFRQSLQELWPPIPPVAVMAATAPVAGEGSTTAVPKPAAQAAEAPATAAEGGISSMLARTTACMLEGVTRVVLEDVADQALAEMRAPPPVSDSAAAGGIVSGDAKSAAESDPQYDWGAYYGRLEQQQQQLAQPQPSSRVAVVAADGASLVMRDCRSCGEQTRVSSKIAWDGAQCAACKVTTMCWCFGDGKRDFCACEREGEHCGGRGGARGGARGGWRDGGRGGGRGGAGRRGAARTTYRCRRCGEPKKGHVCLAARNRATSTAVRRPLVLYDSSGESFSD